MRFIPRAAMLAVATVSVLAAAHAGKPEELTKIIETDPKNPRNYYNRAEAWYRAKEYRKAIEDFAMSARMGFPGANPFIAQGTVRRTLGEHKEAVEAYTEALKADPKNAMAFECRGRTRIVLGDDAGGLDDLDRAVRLDPAKAYYRAAAGLAFRRYDSAVVDASTFLFREKGWREERSPIAAAMAALGLRGLGSANAARRMLLQAKARCDAKNWGLHAVTFLLGETDEKAFLAKSRDRSDETLARTIIGLSADLDGRKEAAQGHWDWIRKNGDQIVTAYFIAMARGREALPRAR